MMKTALFIIDVQNDFCLPTGALYVPGAEQDTARLSRFIKQNASKIDGIILTQDNHQVMDIAHPKFWRDADGNMPQPFTGISPEEVEQGVWNPQFEREQVLEYLKALDSQGEYPHTIWPEHCLMGSEGAAITPSVMQAAREWAADGRFYRLVVKGTNPFTEHFGAFRANVPIPFAPETQMNMALLDELTHYQRIVVAGEARSHCVANTIRQLLDYPELVAKLHILNDCMSNVPGFEQLAEPIFNRAVPLGATITSSTRMQL